MKRLLLAFLLLATPLMAATHYVDCSGGVDTATGTTTGAPWKHMPGMPSCANNCAGYTPAAGDTIVFKGGVSCTTTGNFPVTWNWSGTSGSHITIGTDHAYFTGGSWARPIFDAGNAQINGTNNIFLNLQGGDHLTVNEIEFTGFKATGWTVSNTCAMIQAEALQDLIVDGIYVHGFSIDATSDTNCYAVKGATFGTFNGSSCVQNGVFVGDGTSYGSMISYFGCIKNNVIHDTVGMIFPMGHGEISGNLLYNCGYPSFPSGASNVHADAIQSDGADGTFYIHDNVIHDTGYDGGTNECESMLIGNAGETDYVWDNVLYNIHGNAFSLVQNSAVGVAAYFWNNTVTAGFDGADYCVRAGHATAGMSVIEIRNNHCITSQGRVDDPTLAATTKTINTNTVQTSATASGQGYTSAQSPYVYFPTTGGSTIDSGADLSANCSGTLLTLCKDTYYASSIGAGNAISTPVRTVVSRPQGGVWDTGAYEFVSSALATSGLMRGGVVIRGTAVVK